MCQSCEALTINGILCHERGCPDAWKDYKQECKWCGSSFVPEERYQEFCDEFCAGAYHGYPDDEDLEEVL